MSNETNEGTYRQAVQDDFFIKCFNIISERVWKTAKSKGWWDGDRPDGELIALMHSELSECLEGMRHGNPPDDKIPEFSAVEAELADTVIRIMDFAHERGHRVAEALIAKAKFNQARARKHGGKAF